MDADSADSRYTPELCAYISAEMQRDKSSGVRTHWTNIKDAFVEAKIAVRRTAIPNSCFLVHPQNRDGLGLNHHNAHSNLAQIKRVGADPSLLEHAVAFGFPQDPNQRRVQLEFKRRLNGGY